MSRINIPSVEGFAGNPRNLLKWLKDQPQYSHVQSAEAVFVELLESAARPRSTTTQACVNLCGFVQQCARSDEQPLKEWAFSETTALRLFNFYMEWNEKDNHRSMRLVLDLLTLLLTQNPWLEAVQCVKQETLETIISIISRASSRPLIKSSIISLNYFLGKGIFELDDIARTYRETSPSPARLTDEVLWTTFVAELFSWMDLQHIQPVAGKFLVTVMISLLRRTKGNPQKGSFHVTVETVQQWLEEALENNQDLLDGVKNYILTPLFRTDKDISLLILEKLNRVRPVRLDDKDGLDAATSLQLAALEAGKKEALVEDPSPIEGQVPSNAIVLNPDVIEAFLMNSATSVRSLAMSLLTSSSSSSRPLSPLTISLLQKYLPSCHADPDARFRYEILSHSKDMVNRIKGAIALLQKDLLQASVAGDEKNKSGRIGKVAKEIRGADKDWLRRTLQNQRAFFGWYLSFLRNEMVPTASYQRHITSLKALMAVLKLEKHLTGHETVDIETAAVIYLDYSWIRTLLDLIMDPFDDVREAAVELLMMFPPDALQVQLDLGPAISSSNLVAILEEFCSRASALASRTGRADHADGAARSYGLLCSWLQTLPQRFQLVSSLLDNLDDKLSKAERDLGHAAIEEPIHGDFAALRYVWGILSRIIYEESDIHALDNLQDRVVHACKRIWAAVSYVLCDDSPEGNLPEELEDVEGLDTKDLLSYSFRSIHESSNLMQTVIGTLRLSRKAGTLLPSQSVFEGIGHLTFDQLSKLRHRGAFSTVSLTFTTCCQLALDPHVNLAKDGNVETLLDVWYQGALQCINKQASTTRRSAGIPALMTGILAANAAHPSFQQVMTKLQDISRKPARITETDGSNLPQVHAFNSLKEVFKTSLISKRAEPYLAPCLQLATNSLRSEVWAIRNCALLLLRSLINCLFGTAESKSSMETGWDGKTLRLSYTKHSTLPSLLLDLLKSGEQAMEADAQSSAAESVFPALDIIRRAGPPDAYREELYELISQYLGSHLWHVREIAARTLCSFLLHGDWDDAIRKLLDGCDGSANRLHGVLLTAKFLFERKAELPEHTNIADDFSILNSLLSAAHVGDMALSCPEVRAAYVEITSLWWTVASQPSLNDQGEARSSSQSHTEGIKEPLISSSALLRDRLAIHTTQSASTSRDIEQLRTLLFETLHGNSDTISLVLELLPGIWSPDHSSDLAQVYLQIILRTSAPGPRTQALLNLTDLLDNMLNHKRFDDLPSSKDLFALEAALAKEEVTPSLSQAFIASTGPILAVHILRQNEQQDPPTMRRLRQWGKLVSDTIHEDNTFDMRFNAVSALKSFATATGKACTTPDHIPFAMALYDALNDDDDEVRDVAAIAAAAILGQTLPPIDASSALLVWMGRTFGHLQEFRLYVVSRMAGQVFVHAELSSKRLQWTSPERLFELALQVHDSLFAVEEQNLFIDEVRDTLKWAALFRSLNAEDGELCILRLQEWTNQGMQQLLKLVHEDDGPLGWTSKPDVFAVCTRIIVCATTLAETGRFPVFQTLLKTLRETGRQSRLHGLLVSMAEGKGEDRDDQPS